MIKEETKFQKIFSERKILKDYMREKKPDVTLEDLLSKTSSFRVTREFSDLFNRKMERRTRKLPSMASTLLMMKKCGSFGRSVQVLRRIRTQ